MASTKVTIVLEPQEYRRLKAVMNEWLMHMMARRSNKSNGLSPQDRHNLGIEIEELSKLDKEL